jgi:diguanylate cyclase (GGDEF)-like protein
MDGGQKYKGAMASLRIRLLASLAAILAAIQIVFVLTAVIGMGDFLARVFDRTAASQTAQLGRVIKSALRQQMLKTTDDAVDLTLADVAQTEGIRGVWIVDKQGRVARASSRALIGRVFDKQRDEICVTCHTSSTVQRAQTSFTTSTTAEPVIRHVETLANERACWRCHDRSVRTIGVIGLEQSTRAYRTAAATARRRFLGGGAVALIALVGVTIGMVSLLVVRPVDRLMTGVQRLAAGDLSVRVRVSGSGELSRLSAAFNSMAGDLGRSIDEIRDKNAELSVVYSILQRLTKTIDLAQLKDIVLQTFVEVLRANQAALVSREPDGGCEVFLLADSMRLRRTRWGNDARVRLPQGFPDDVVEGWLRQEVSAPMLTGDRRAVILPIGDVLSGGVLLMIQRTSPFSEPEANLNLLGLVGSHARVAFDNARLYTLAITDDLTRLFTVRCFHNRLEEQVVQCGRDKQPFSLLMVDLDSFKTVNDTLGHQAGDAVLKETARVMLASIRVTDTGYRYGGDEFSLLLPGANGDEAREIGERVRKAIEAASVVCEGRDPVRVTASIGVATCPSDGVTAHELVGAADAALYLAKQRGRNQSCRPDGCV